MSDILKSWALGLCAVGLLSAAAQAAAGRGRQTAAIRLLEAMAAALVLLAPLRNTALRIPDAWASTADGFSAVQESADRLTAKQVEAYIEEEAAARGIACTAKAQCETANGVFYLRALRLYYAPETGQAEKDAFAKEMAQAFRTSADTITEGS